MSRSFTRAEKSQGENRKLASTCTTFPKNLRFLKKSVDTENHAPCCRGDKESKKIFPATHWNRLLNNWEQTRSKVACLHACGRYCRCHGKLHSDTHSDFNFGFSGKFWFRKCIQISNPNQKCIQISNPNQKCKNPVFRFFWKWCEALSAVGPKGKKCRPKMATNKNCLNH